MGSTEALPSDHPYKDVAPVFDNSPKLTPVIGQVGYDTVTAKDWSSGCLMTMILPVRLQILPVMGTMELMSMVPSPKTHHWVEDIRSISSVVANMQVSEGDESTFGGGDAFTMALWYKRLPDQNYEPVVSKRRNANVGWMIAKLESPDLYFYSRGPLVVQNREPMDLPVLIPEMEYGTMWLLFMDIRELSSVFITMVY